MASKKRRSRPSRRSRGNVVHGGRSRAKPLNDPFTHAYLVTALWSSTDNSTPSGGFPLDDNYDVSDIAPGTHAKMSRDAASFQRKNAKDLREAYKHARYDEKVAGHDLWLSRNGHGAGFWDRGLGKVGERLDKAAEKYGEFYLFVGDDKQIHGDDG